MTETSELLAMSWDTVKEIEKRYLFRRFGRPKLKNLRQIAIDDIAKRKSPCKAGIKTAIRCTA